MPLATDSHPCSLLMLAFTAELSSRFGTLSSEPILRRASSGVHVGLVSLDEANICWDIGSPSGKGATSAWGPRISDESVGANVDDSAKSLGVCSCEIDGVAISGRIECALEEAAFIDVIGLVECITVVVPTAASGGVTADAADSGDLKTLDCIVIIGPLTVGCRKRD